MRSMVLLLFLLLFPAQTVAQQYQDLKCPLFSGTEDFGKCTDRQWSSYLGKYVCLIDHFAGIQYDNDKYQGQPFVGRIRPIESKFFMEIAEDSSVSCRSAFAVFVPDEKSCMTKYKMVVKSKDFFTRGEIGYSALNPQTFTTAGGAGGITIVDGGRFGGYYSSGWDSYTFQGRCEKLN
jgi:hypothetical protein